MRGSSLHQRRVLRTVAGMLMLTLLTIAPPARAEGEATLVLRPHCENGSVDPVFGGVVPEIDGTMELTEGRCPLFPVADPLNRETPILQKGDMLDMDVVLLNPGQAPVSRVRAWIAYDPSILEGMELSLSDAFPIPTPGESDIVPEEGYVKIGAGTENPGNEAEIVLARLRFVVTSLPSPSTILSFATDDRAAAIRTDGEGEENILTPAQASLIVRLNAEEAATSATSSEPESASSSSTAASTASSMPSSAGSQSASSAPGLSSSPTIFRLLQVQNLRVTTQGSSIFAAWDALGSRELAGYALYYGTVSGKYIQRRTVGRDELSVTLRALPENETYYLAVRGVNAQGSETEFSQEVAVTVGEPSTATALLTAAGISPPTPTTGGTVAGSTGLPAPMLLFLGLSAVIGTCFAFRRQILASAAR